MKTHYERGLTFYREPARVPGLVIRRIEQGHSYSVVIHPNHWTVIEQLLAQGGGHYDFTTETGDRWILTVDGSLAEFRHVGQDYRIETSTLAVLTLR